MKKSAALHISLFALAISIAAIAGCDGRGASPACATLYQYDFVYPVGGYGYRMVDVILVVDNSHTAWDEQALLAESLPSLIDTLTVRSDENGYRLFDDVRIAAVTTDMGLSWGGQPYEDGDGWPGTNPCSDSGDNGAFQVYGSGSTVVIDGEEIECPPLSSSWTETNYWSRNEDLNLQVACLSQLGTQGCGLEQQFAAPLAALARSDQQAFVRELAVLLVLTVSDEDDCSLEDGPGFFATDEIQNPDGGPSRLNLACGYHPEYLYSADHLREALHNLKTEPEKVVFAAFTGVPLGDECEGSGVGIGGCLDQPAMQLEEVVKQNAAGQDAFYFAPACSRVNPGGGKVGEGALPGRRFVELAVEMGEGGYIASVCEGDWREHMVQVGNLALDLIEQPCWSLDERYLDPETGSPGCNVYVEFVHGESCPAEFADPDPMVLSNEDADGVEQGSIMCRLPLLSASGSCEDLFDSGITSEGFGWYYCEYEEPEGCDGTIVFTGQAEEAIRGLGVRVLCGGDQSECGQNGSGS